MDTITMSHWEAMKTGGVRQLLSGVTIWKERPPFVSESINTYPMYMLCYVDSTHIFGLGDWIYPKIPFRVKKKSIAIMAPAGRVTSQERIMLPTTRRSRAPMPLAMPTPRTAPTRI